MNVPPRFYGEPAIVLGTGPSLADELDPIRKLRAADRARLFGMNCTFMDFGTLDVFTACNIEWWNYYGAEFERWRGGRDCDAWHWDAATAARWRLNHVEGRWGSGLSTDPGYIHLGHSSGVQALGLAVHYGCDPILLVGYDMTEKHGEPRHYFRWLSDQAGEYPLALRHFAKQSNGHEGLLPIYAQIAEQPGLPRIVNCTPGGKLNCLPRMSLAEALP